MDDRLLPEPDRRPDRLARRQGPEPSPYPPSFPELSPRATAIVVAALVLVALVSFFFIAEWASSTQTHASTIATLDAKKDTVMSLVEGSTASSAAISLLPGDAGTPIADKLVDLSSDFLVVIAAIYLEKYLLTIVGYVAFKVLVPAACLLGIVALLARGLGPWRWKLAGLGARLAVFGVAISLVVPASVFVSGMIERTYEASIAETLETAEQTAEAVEGSVAEGDASDEGSGGILEFIQSIPESVAGGVTSLTDEAQRSLNNFIEALAVMIVTSCVIPILVLVFFLWLARAVLGVNVNVPWEMMYPRTFRRR